MVLRLCSASGGNMELRDKILEGAIQVFNKKGMKFTMDDIAEQLSMSKKTIYTVFSDKNSLIEEMVDYGFDSVKKGEAAILNDPNKSTLEKIRGILSVLPDGYRDVDYRKLYMLKDKHPEIYRKFEQRLETGWESTIALLEQGMKEGVIREISIPIVKTMFEATIEQFLQRDVLITNQIAYSQALDQLVDIIIDGVVAK